MNSSRLPQSEIGFIFDKTVRFANKHKTASILTYLFFIAYFSMSALQIPFLEYGNFRITSLMEQRAFETSMIYYPKQSWVGIRDVNPNLLKAIISMEDGKFFIHKGIDWKELNTSLKLNMRRGRSARGASTITMQLAKNLYLTTDKTLLRKAKEFIITFRMEKELTKKAILQNYINAIEWGEGIFGIKKAADIYFGKEPAALNKNECARLAAVIPSPLRYKPNTNAGYVLRRSAIIRSRLNDVILSL